MKHCVVILAVLSLLSSCQKSAADHVEQGMRLAESGKSEEAGLEFQKALQLDANLGEAHYQLGRLALRNGDGDGALTALTQAARLLPERDDVQVALADLYVEAMRRNMAEARFVAAVENIAGQLRKRNPASFDGWRLDGIVKLARKDAAGATDSFARVEAARQRDPALALPWLDALQMAGKPDAAKRLAEETIEKHPQADAVYDALYALLVREKRFEEAEAVLRRKLEKRGGEARPHLQLAEFYARQGREADAEAALRTMMAKLKSALAYGLAAEFYAVRGEFARAEAILQAGMQAGVDRPTLQGKLAWLRREAGDLDKADEAIRGALAERPKDMQLRVLRASIMAERNQAGERAALISELRELVTQLPRDPAAPAILARVLLASGDEVAGRQALAQALQRDGQHVPALYLWARNQAAAGDFDGARNTAEQILQLQPGTPAAEGLRVEIAMQQKQFAAAKADIDRMLRANPKRLDALRMLGDLQMLTNAPGAARETFQRFREAGGAPVVALQGQASALVAMKQAGEAMKLLRQAVAQEPAAGPLRGLLAATALRTGDARTALEEFSALARQYPQAVDLKLAIAQAQRALGQLGEAKRAAEEAVQLDANNLSVLAELGDIHAEQGNFREALQVYRQLEAKRPKDPRILNNVAYALLESKGDLNEALRKANEAVQLAPDAAAYWETLGNIHLKKGNGEQAVQAFRTLLGKGPQTAYHRYLLAIGLELNGEGPEAIREFEQALRSGLSAPVAADARARLEKLRPAR